jgi:hypothetical protein
LLRQRAADPRAPQKLRLDKDQIARRLDQREVIRLQTGLQRLRADILGILRNAAHRHRQPDALTAPRDRA